MLDANADITWTLLDSVTRIAQIEITDGRQSIFEVTEAATCRVLIHDTTGDFDPNNPSKPYFGIEGKPLAVALYNPVTAIWVPQFRGSIEDINIVIEPVINPSTGKPILANIEIEAIGVFAYLARAGMQIGVSGDPSPSPGIVFYEDGPVANPGGPPGRIEHLLNDAMINVDMYTAFSGNVNVLESKYDAGDQFLGALREAADAELPGLANAYEDKLGAVVFHGRLSRLTPDAVAAGAGAAWDFNRWNAGDGTAILADSTMAQIREFSYGRPLDRVVNSATAYPADILDVDIPAQFDKDDASITALGIRPWDKPGLIIKEHKTNGDTGAEQCLKMIDFMISYFSVPMTWIDQITFKSVRPSDPRAAATWGLLTGASIADIVNVNVGYPGSTGVQDSDNFIEGRNMVITPLQPGFDMVELSLNLSPYVEDTLGIFV